MTMDDDTSTLAIVPPKLREELEKNEIEVCKQNNGTSKAILLSNSK